MKKNLCLFLLLGYLVSCSDRNGVNSLASQETVPVHSEHGLKSEKAEGAKWNADESTGINVQHLQALANRFSEKQNLIIADYTLLGVELQKGLEQLVKECRMKGADHDALHTWLLPLQQGIKSLQAATGPKEKGAKFAEISYQLSIYNQLFE